MGSWACPSSPWLPPLSGSPSALLSNPPSSGLDSSGQGWSGFMQACRADGMHSLSVFSDVLSQLESGHRVDIYTMEICKCCQSAPSFFKGARWYTSPQLASC